MPVTNQCYRHTRILALKQHNPKFVFYIHIAMKCYNTY